MLTVVAAKWECDHQDDVLVFRVRTRAEARALRAELDTTVYDVGLYQAAQNGGAGRLVSFDLDDA